MNGRRLLAVAGVTAVVLVAAGLVACGGSAGPSASPSPAPTSYTMLYSGETVSVRVGERFTVVLKENPSTGYQWTMTLGPGLKLESSTYVGPSPSPTPLLGAGGVRTWVVKVEEAGTTTLTGTYARPWEKADESTRHFSLTVNTE